MRATFEKSEQGTNVRMEMELKVAIFFANRIFHLAQFQSPLLNPPPNHPKHLWILSRKEKVSVDYNES